MNLEMDVQDDMLWIKVSGELDMAVAGDFRKQVEELMDKLYTNNLVLNLSKVDFIDSSGLGAILGRYKRVTTYGGKMAIVAAQPQVRRILELSGILKIVPDFETEDAALMALQGGRTSA